jgi:hypothetical protein
MKKLVVATSVALSVLAQNVFAGAYDELTPEQKTAVQNGQQVFFTRDAEGSAWPKAYLFQRIDATPEEAAAVFSDYELQKTYIPGLLKSQISKRISKTVTEVDYTLEVPVFADEHYTVRDTLGSYDNGDSFRIDWTLVRASSTKATVGNARFERLGTGTLMAYYNFVTPGAAFAGAVRGKAMKQVQETGKAIVRQIEKERRENQPLLQRQIQALRAALAR